MLFDSKNPFSVIAVFGLIVTIGLTSWLFGYSQIKASTQEQVETKQESWEKIKPKTYSYNVSYGCMFAAKTSVIVINGVEHVSGENFNIDKLFTVAARVAVEGDKVNIKYHKVYGFPELIDVDWDNQTYDDECFYTVENFEL